MTYDIEIKWGDMAVELEEIWTLKCASIIEHFGLPGTKYTTTLTDFGITFKFNIPEDAFVARLLIGDN